MRVRVFYWLLLFCFLQLFQASSGFAAPRFGLWVEAENLEVRPWRSRKEFDAFLKFVEEGGFTDLYCQVFRGGRSWFKSTRVDDTPYKESLKVGFDPLQETISWAHQRGIKVHAWVNVLRVGPDKDTPLLENVGPDALIVDSYGNPIVRYGEDGSAPGALRGYYKLGTPGIWLDPSSGKLRRYILEILDELLTAHPKLDGIHLDMIRYPEAVRIRPNPSLTRPEFGYSRAAVNGFYQLAGKTPPPEPSSQLRQKLDDLFAWSVWRRSQLTLLVFEINQLIREKLPHGILSAAVIASPERAYSEMYQDWSTWLKNGIIDSALPMSYSRDNLRVARETQYAVHVAKSENKQVIIGLGAWLMFKNPQRLIEQGMISRRAGADGVILFSYANLASPSGEKLVKQFRDSVFPSLNK